MMDRYVKERNFCWKIQDNLQQYYEEFCFQEQEICLCIDCYLIEPDAFLALYFLWMITFDNIDYAL